MERSGQDVSFLIEQDTGTCSFVGEFAADLFMSADGLDTYQRRSNGLDSTGYVRRCSHRCQQQERQYAAKGETKDSHDSPNSTSFPHERQFTTKALKSEGIT